MKIMMVCLGNICRSPLAEGILSFKAKKLGLDIEVASAGTANFHVGESPDPRSIKKAKEYNIDITNQRGRHLKKEDLSYYDMIYVMDQSNLENALSLTENDSEKSKIKLILSEINDEIETSVPDPYHGGEQGFEDVYQMLDKATDSIIKNTIRL